jgi:hypothetical protein
MKLIISSLLFALSMPVASAFDDYAGFGRATNRVFEVDLLFPRPGVWSAVNNTAIVFAVQNPGLAASLEATLSWTIYRMTNKTTSQRALDSGSVALRDMINSTTPNSFIVVDTTNVMTGIDDSWELDWSMGHSNCTWFDNGATSVLGIEYNSERTTVKFNTSQSAQQQSSIDVALGVDTCRQTDYYAYNVTAFNELPSDSDANPIPSCAVVGPAPTGTSNCTISDTIKNSVKKSFSASVSSSACRATATPTTDSKGRYINPCSAPPESDNSARSHHDVVAHLWIIVATIGLATLVL